MLRQGSVDPSSSSEEHISSCVVEERTRFCFSCKPEAAFSIGRGYLCRGVVTPVFLESNLSLPSAFSGCDGVHGTDASTPRLSKFDSM